MTTLRDLALAATPGNLHAIPQHVASFTAFADSAYFYAAASPEVVLALLDVVEAAALRRNSVIHGQPDYADGQWVAIARSDFDALRAALARVEEVTRDPA